MEIKKELNCLVGSNIKRARENAGYTQERFAEMIEIGPKSLSAIERGTVGISLSALKRVCEVLSVSSDSLLFEEKEANPVAEWISRLENLPPQEFTLLAEIMNKVMEAFVLHTPK